MKSYTPKLYYIHQIKSVSLLICLRLCCRWLFGNYLNIINYSFLTCFYVLIFATVLYWGSLILFFLIFIFTLFYFTTLYWFCHTLTWIHLFLISSASIRSIPFLPLTAPIFAWSVPLVSLIFLKRSLVFPILLFSSISLHCSLWKTFLSLFAILWNSAFRCVYLSFSLLPFASLLFWAICKASSDDHFVFSAFLFHGMITTACTMLQSSIHSSSGTPSSRFNPLNLFVTSTV